MLVLTGAGISAESGLATFRGTDGLWEGHHVEEVASPEGFEANPELVWRFYIERRRAALKVEPNAAHRVLAGWEEMLGDRFLLVTQNVDGLHQRAGSQRAIEIHGSLFRTRCHYCDLPAFEDLSLEPQRLHHGCVGCRDDAQRIALRPDIVWFGEMLDPAHLAQLERFMVQAGASGKPFHFVAIGTSGHVYPAAGLVVRARQAGAQTHLVNLEVPTNLDTFEHFHQGEATKVLSTLYSAC